MSEGGEFDHIRRWLAPLSAGAPGAFDLTDDAAVFAGPDGSDWVVAADMLCEGVHFLPEDPPESVAAKALATNFSDLAAMGACARFYLCSIAWPKTAGAEKREAFARGLKHAQSSMKATLIGGDTTTVEGPWAIAITAIGECPAGSEIRRSGARPGEALFVSGRIGAAWLGLRMAKAGDVTDQDALRAYRTPQPRQDLGLALRGRASSAIDISDGLIADLDHIAQASGVALRVDADRVPYHERLPKTNHIAALSAGDDYELAFTAPPELEEQLRDLGRALSLPITRIGCVETGEGVRLIDSQGEMIRIEQAGFTHF